MTIQTLHMLLVIIHLFGMTLGAGAAFMGDIAFFKSLKDRKISKDEYAILSTIGKVVWIGLLLSVISGIGLFSMNVEVLSHSPRFLIKMTIVMVIIINGVFLHTLHIPFLRKNLDKILSRKNQSPIADIPFMIMSGVISVSSWISVIVLGGLSGLEYSYLCMLSIYTAILSFALLTTSLFMKKHINTVHRKKIIAATLAIACVTLLLVGASQIFSPRDISENKIKDQGTAVHQKKDTYTTDDVALHGNPEDCWLIIDDLVFNATEAARLHPAMFHCGQDVSANYHRNHGTNISSKMMKFHIGEVIEGSGITHVDESFESSTSLNPYKELYVSEGSWNIQNLMVIVEKDAEKLLFIDGNTHTEIGRIHDIGFQPHTSVYTPDAQYMFIISRDGWLTKISLETLDPVTSIHVGKNSRGTALTDNGKYLAVGNYEPGNIVIVDPVSMEVLKTIPTVGTLDGKEVESRVGALVENGYFIIAALKDLNSVWVIDTRMADFPVKNKYWNIGSNQTPLHDAFLTPDGKYFIVASMGSHTVWVLDTQTWDVIKEIPTGETPHTGPGATWGNTIYVPALGEGLITAIDTQTWDVVASIKTGGPGLFVRSYTKDSEYPYVWADTAFGDKHDEIYVIDARINEIVETLIPVPGESSWHPEFSYNGDFVYIVSQSANEIEVYDAHTFEIVKRITSDTPSAVSNIGLRIEEKGL